MQDSHCVLSHCLQESRSNFCKKQWKSNLFYWMKRTKQKIPSQKRRKGRSIGAQRCHGWRSCCLVQAAKPCHVAQRTLHFSDSPGRRLGWVTTSFTRASWRLQQVSRSRAHSVALKRCPNTTQPNSHWIGSGQNISCLCPDKMPEHVQKFLGRCKCCGWWQWLRSSGSSWTGMAERTVWQRCAFLLRFRWFFFFNVFVWVGVVRAAGAASAFNAIRFQTSHVSQGLKPFLKSSTTQHIWMHMESLHMTGTPCHSGIEGIVQAGSQAFRTCFWLEMFFKVTEVTRWLFQNYGISFFLVRSPESCSKLCQVTGRACL